MKDTPVSKEEIARFPYRLESCVWEITLACCFSCAYCGSCAGKKRENELTAEECACVARQLKDLGCKRVSLIGGEVFMRSDWQEILSSLTSKGIRTCVITNGYRMSDKILRGLLEAKVESVAVSIDGPEELHDAFRQKGSYRRALETVSALRGAGIPVSVISALRKDNAGRLEEFFETLKTLDIFAWQIQACSYMGSAEKNALDVRFDMAKVIEFAVEANKRAPFAVGVADNIGYYTPQEPLSRGRDGAVFDGCSAGLTAIGIDSEGNVRGCESMYDPLFNEGNLRQKSLWEIWSDPSAFAYNRAFTPEMLTGACASCPHGTVCAGGCRSYNYFSTRRLYEHPLCARNSAKSGCRNEKRN